jgi:NDP-mannose synthase
VASRPLADAGAARPPRAIVLAGGRGTRLAPFTSVLPKPLMPIGNRSILELVVDQLVDHGIRDITLSVGYLSHLIRAVLDNGGRNPRARIRYVHEDEPLGTAGPLRLVKGLNDTFLVMNGDILTTLDYGELVEHHRRQGNALTIATHRRTVKIDYGVLDSYPDGDRARVMAYTEKPELSVVVSMGIYVLEPHVAGHVPEGEHFDFPELVQALLDAGEPVGSYEYDGLWFDIGRREDYERAVGVWNGDGDEDAVGGATRVDAAVRAPA